MPISDFVDISFNPRLPIPSSCIEGAEYIIQCISKGSILAWKKNTARKPHVWAEFGGGVKFNISNQPDFHTDPKCVGLKSYPFGSTLPNIGYGLILLNKTSTDATSYNMHLGAVVAVDDSYTYISDVSEGKTVSLVNNWPVKKITQVGDFRIPGYPTKEFAVGILYPL